MRRVAALARMRLAAYAGTQRFWGPMVATLAFVLGAHAGGVAPASEAYAFSAMLLFGVFGWQTKLVLDTEADEQRLLARVAVGAPGRELVAGLLAAGAAVVPAILFALAAPLVLGAVDIPRSGLTWLALGVWVHLLSAGCALGVGALASRAVVHKPGWATLLLVAAPVLVLVLGTRNAAGARWLVPQLFATAHLDGPGDLGSIAVVTAHALGWAAVVLAGYAALRVTRR